MASTSHRQPAGPARLRLLLGLVVAALSLASCDDDDDTTGPTTIEGEYVLVSINGASLPFTVPNTGAEVIIVQSAVIDIDGSGAYDGSVEGSRNGTNQVLFADAGTTTETGTTVTFTSSTFPLLTYSGTRSGDVLSFAIPTAALVQGASGTLTLSFER